MSTGAVMSTGPLSQKPVPRAGGQRAQAIAAAFQQTADPRRGAASQTVPLHANASRVRILFLNKIFQTIIDLPAWSCGVPSLLGLQHGGVQELACRLRAVHRYTTRHRLLSILAMATAASARPTGHRERGLRPAGRLRSGSTSSCPTTRRRT